MFCDIAINENYVSFFSEYQHHSLIAKGNLNWDQRCDIAAIALVYRRNSKTWPLPSYPYKGGHLKNS